MVSLGIDNRLLTILGERS